MEINLYDPRLNRKVKSPQTLPAVSYIYVYFSASIIVQSIRCGILVVSFLISFIFYFFSFFICYLYMNTPTLATPTCMLDTPPWLQVPGEDLVEWEELVY